MKSKYIIKTNLDFEKVSFATMKKICSETVFPRVLSNIQNPVFEKNFSKIADFEYFFIENKQKFAKKVHIFCFDIGLFFKKLKNGFELFVIDGNGFDAGSFVTNIFDNVFSMDNIQLETFKKEVFAQYERIDKKNLLVQKFDKMD